jgi:hypothetical protein
MEDFDTNKLHRELPCGHSFHPQCIDEWLLYKSFECPNCRVSILKEENQEEKQEENIDFSLLNQFLKKNPAE